MCVLAKFCRMWSPVASLYTKSSACRGITLFSPHPDSHCCCCCRVSLLTGPQRAGRISPASRQSVLVFGGGGVLRLHPKLDAEIGTCCTSSRTDCESEPGSALKTHQNFTLGPKSWHKLIGFVFISRSLDENVLYVGAAGHRTLLRLDTNSFRREEINDQGPDCRYSW